MSIFIFFEVPHVALYYMHSSRMRTARSFTVSNRIRWRGALPLDADPLLDADPSPPDADPRGQKEWHALVKILPCPKLRLRAVKIFCYSLTV